MKMIEESDAEFVCLQEVTSEFLMVLLEYPAVRDRYFLSGNLILNYGVIILTKFPSLFYEMPFPTHMGRSLLICEPINGINNIPLLVSTSHLESLGHTPVRIEQMKMSFSVLGEVCDSLMMGDCNFDSRQHPEEQAYLKKSGWVDVYLKYHEGVEGQTMLPRHRYSGWRPDKIFCPPSLTYWTLSDLKMVGKFSIPSYSG